MLAITEIKRISLVFCRRVLHVTVRADQGGLDGPIAEQGSPLGPIAQNEVFPVLFVSQTQKQERPVEVFDQPDRAFFKQACQIASALKAARRAEFQALGLLAP